MERSAGSGRWRKRCSGSKEAPSAIEEKAVVVVYCSSGSGESADGGYGGG